ncbi:TRAP transporter small permease [Consotaella salsifontis]|uniref:TRAP transporter small permease protein n=1 Tax=Consotaella salsifontis TaxID=1365950 RepID=A0A1T4MTG3_9HYPH|nr:TRAP transporter small permease [Consotaella salsifontis]SJZ69928.1 TRAP-type C4-dicarboxylate transport system, small permease component [Consotaella salsifontis]
MLSLLSWLEDWFGKLLLAAIVVLVFTAAIARTVDHPLVWSVDLAQALFVWLCFAGAVKGLARRSHIGVDYFVQKLPLGMRRVVDFVMAALAVVFLAVMSWFGIQLTLLNWERVYGDSGISYAWVTIAVPIGCGLLAVILLYQMFIAIRDGALIFAKETPATDVAPGQKADDLMQQEL